MSCPHASTTTVAWSVGELDGDDHALHVAHCPDCQASLEALEAAEAAVAPFAGALRQDQVPPAAVEPVAVRATPARQDGRFYGLLAVAAALLLTLFATQLDGAGDPTSNLASRGPAPSGAPTNPVAARVAPMPPPVPTAPATSLDDELDALELELDALRTDPSIL